MKRKLDAIEGKKAKGIAEAITFQVDATKQVAALEAVQKSIDSLYELINDKDDFDFERLVRQLSLLNDKLDLDNQFKDLKQAIVNNKVEPVKRVSIEDFTELLKAVKNNKPRDIDLSKLEKAIINVEQRITEQSVPEQAPEDYTPVRRVIKVGNRLIFDDRPTPGSISGGGGSSSSGDGAIQDGSNSAIEASVLDYANSNPLAVRLTDTTGDYAAAGGGTEYTEDVAAPADPVGKAVTLVRDDTPGALVTTEGDWVAQRGTNYGAAYAQIVTSAGAFVDTFGGGTQYTEGDIDASITGNALLFEGAANALVAATGDATNGLDVDVTRSALPSGASTSANQTTIIGHLDGVETLLTDIEADTDTLAVVGGGTEAAAQRVTIANDSTGVLSIDDNAGSLTVDNAGTFAVQDATAQASLSVMDDWDNTASDGASISGDVAHDSVDAGEPAKIGGKALDVGASPTVAANDRTNATFLRNGVQLVLGGDPNIISKNLNVTDADGAQTDVALVTVAAGTAIVVTKVSAMLDSATTATGGVAVRIGFGTANTPAADSAGIILAHPGISAGSGVVEGSGNGIIGIGASNEDLRLTCEDPTGGNLDILVTYLTIAIG